ncbi:MAG: glycosyltransferase family 2 protein [Verrucomicrobiota bacterium]
MEPSTPASRTVPRPAGAKAAAVTTVTIAMAAYNEEAVLEKNVGQVADFMRSIDGEYEWEILIVNDGSSDRTAEIANVLSQRIPEVRAHHHDTNRGLCEGLKSAFRHAHGKYIVTLDADLSYEPYHIRLLLDRIRETRADVVVASPYMRGGKVENVPFLRALLSKWSNIFLSRIAPENIHTFTGMVRAYDAKFIRSLNLKSVAMDVNPEIIYKAFLLRARIEEVPAVLRWRQDDATKSRKSSLSIPWHTLAILFSGFIFRPFLFFLIPGFLMLMTSLLSGFGLLLHGLLHHGDNVTGVGPMQFISHSIGSAYDDHGILFFGTAGLFIIAVQFLTLGFLSMQSKRYFEEGYHFATTRYRAQQGLLS